SAVSRFDDTPPLLTLDLTEQGYLRIDPQDSQQGNHNVQRILAALPTDPAAALSIGDLVGRLGLARRIRFRPRARFSRGRLGQAHSFHYTPRLLEWFP
ncbi:MAG: hypothetical protein K1X50_15125, partial [Candidatus Promineofilum sp.]|nr:hypothetical protein [Promineifilum sp.]